MRTGGRLRRIRRGIAGRTQGKRRANAGRTQGKRRRTVGREWVAAAALGVSLAVWCIGLLSARLSPELSTLARAQTERIVAGAVADQLQEALAAQGTALVELERDETGRAVALRANTPALNRVRETLLRGLNEDLERLRRNRVGVPIGSLTPWKTLAGVGPEVKIGVYAAPSVTAEFSSHFSQAGVNQTRHVMELEVTVTLQLLLPKGSETQEIKTTAPVAETVIVGAVPEEYWETGR